MDDLQLQLFSFEPPEPEPPPVRLRIDALAAALGHHLGDIPVHLTLTDNRSSILHARPCRTGDGHEVRLHWSFLEAPEEIVAAVAVLAGPAGRSRAAHRARGALRTWFSTGQGDDRPPPEELLPFVTARRRRASIDAPRAATQGEVHDLAEIRDDVNRRYFGDRLEVAITWADAPPPRRRRRRRAASGPRRATLKLGSWVETDRLVRLHPVLDHASVPRYVVASVVHHEMLHAEMGVETRNGRRRVHPPEFRRREREFEEYERAKGWIEKNLGGLLRRRDRLRRVGPRSS